MNWKIWKKSAPVPLAAPDHPGTPAPREDMATDPVSVINLRYEPAAIAQSLDVSRLHSILRSAENGNTRDLMALYRDVIASSAHMQAEFAKRKMAVIGDAFAVQPADQSDPDDVDAADLVTDNLASCKNLRMGLAYLLDSTLYPVSLVEKIFTPTGQTSPAYALTSLVHVPHHLLDFSTGVLRLYDVDPVTGAILGTTHEPDPARYIIHRGHILTMPDNWGGPMRSILFWWLLATMSREWWGRFLDRYGHPFLVGTYPRGDKDAKSVLERAFALSVKLGGLVVSEGTGVEIKEVAAGNNGAAYETLTAFCNREISKLIVGQTLSSEAQSTGLGSGVSNQQETVRQDIRRFDATLLVSTLRDQLFPQILSVNGQIGASPSMVFGQDSIAASKAMSADLTAMKLTDVEPDDDALPVISARLGLSIRRRAAAPTPFSAFSRSLRPV